MNKLDVYFVGDRPYIQGSLIIETAVDQVKKKLGINTVLSEIKFSKITCNEVYLSTECIQENNCIGSMVLVDDNGEAHEYFFIEGEEAVKKKIKDTGAAYRSFERCNELDGVAVFEYKHSDIGNLLKAVIASSKKMHSDLSASTYDVWFTGIRGAELPINDDFLPSTGSIEFINRFHMKKALPYQTMSKVVVRSLSDNKTLKEYDFSLTFAYKI